MFPPRIELGTFRVLGECDNRYTTETQLMFDGQLEEIELVEIDTKFWNIGYNAEYYLSMFSKK